MHRDAFSSTAQVSILEYAFSDTLGSVSNGSSSSKPVSSHLFRFAPELAELEKYELEIVPGDWS